MEGNQPLILLIDDDADLKDILATKLEAGGFKVEKAANGEEGITKAKELKPSLIFLDVQMPGMSGIQTLAKMKEDPELVGIKVFFLTNLGESDDQNAWVDDKFAQDAGALGHFKKSADLNLLVAKAKEVTGAQ